MFRYPANYKVSKRELQDIITKLKSLKYHVFSKSLKLDDEYSIDKITIKSTSTTKNRLVITLGLHGIEGYVGHASLMFFLNNHLSKLDDSTEVVIYHVLNPFGMSKFKRTNTNNVDLNRNYSRNGFSKENVNYELVSNVFKPRKFKTKFSMNTSYYFTLTNSIRKHGVSKLNDAILLGQNKYKNGLYYSGTEFQKETKIIQNELKDLLKGVSKCMWIDLHTGYGPRYQMSIVNSQYEKEKTKELLENINYPLILGYQDNDFYDIDGDMIEYIYEFNSKQKTQVDLLALCFEYGTIGDKVRNQVESLKALTFENYLRFKSSSKEAKEYVHKLMKAQFMPHEEKWREKACNDFDVAMRELIKYYKI